MRFGTRKARWIVLAYKPASAPSVGHLLQLVGTSGWMRVFRLPVFGLEQEIYSPAWMRGLHHEVWENFLWRS